MEEFKAQKGLPAMEQELDMKEQRLSKIGKNTWATQLIFVGMYLSAIIVANLLTVKYGPSISILNAFLFIGLDLTARDKLHEAWKSNGIVWKMGLLIAVGSMLSWILNHNAGQIAVASFVAFACAALVDTITYQFLHKRGYFVKVNGSNVFSAAVDSLVFPTLAFGGILWTITIGQFLAKTFGGAVWSVIIKFVSDKLGK